eukprot:9298254-Pyramimonas_sp.AAC.1
MPPFSSPPRPPQRLSSNPSPASVVAAGRGGGATRGRYYKYSTSPTPSVLYAAALPSGAPRYRDVGSNVRLPLLRARAPNASATVPRGAPSWSRWVEGPDVA